ncbi:MAG: uracil-DNA glycosylase family protein [Sneathiella sp.]
MPDHLKNLLAEIRACKICEPHLVDGCRPVLQVSSAARIMVVGQAPGRRVHESGIPFDDPSGERLRDWMGIDRNIFYDEKQINIIPMGFCFPGTGKSGDLPPRKECAAAWRNRLLENLAEVDFTIVIGKYAMDWHLAGKGKKTLTDTVKSWQEYWPKIAVLPHPSPRNNIWLKRNPWFEGELLPPLKARIKALL